MNTWMISLQNSNSPTYDMMIFFSWFYYNYFNFYYPTYFFIMMMMINNKFTNRFLLQGHLIELIWTIISMFILIFIAIVSLKILYLTDEIHNNKMPIKAIGHQWYWSYEYPDFNNIEFDSFMIPSNNLTINEFRLLDVDVFYRCMLPFKLPIRILTTSMNVIHAWTVPSLGIKMDSIPGRLNQTMLFMNRPGLFFGQCSEICGTNHSFMPIVIESTNFHNFKNWLM